MESVALEFGRNERRPRWIRPSPRRALTTVGAMSRIAPSDVFAGAELDDLGQGDRINLGVAAIMTRRPEVAQALEDHDPGLSVRHDGERTPATTVG